MAEYRIKLSNLLSSDARPLTVAVGGPHILTIVRLRGNHTRARFRSNSAALLPVTLSPEDPDVPSGLAAAAIALRYTELAPGRRVLVSGHTDSEGSDASNQTLSLLRGQALYGMVAGQRDLFAHACFGPHLSSSQRYPSTNDVRGKLWDDYIDVLGWASHSFGWGCAYSAKTTLWNATCNFQRAYNADTHAGNPTGADLDITGKFDEPTWAAVFDCYETQLSQMLQTDRPGLTKLRERITLIDDNNAIVACGEEKPLDHLGEDHVRSLTNRRAHVVFFEPRSAEDVSEFPCLQDACAAGRCSYLHAEWCALGPLPAKVEELRRPLSIRVVDSQHQLVSGSPCKVQASGETFDRTTDGHGIVRVEVQQTAKECQVEWEIPAPKSSGFLMVARGDVHLCPSQDEEGSHQRLQNLGYAPGDALANGVYAYQWDNDAIITGQLADIRDQLHKWHDGGSGPSLVRLQFDDGAGQKGTVLARNSAGLQAGQATPDPAKGNSGVITVGPAQQNVPPKLTPSGWSEAKVHEEAKNISVSTNNNGREGKIDDVELATFRAKAHAAGMQNQAALDWYRKYETAAGLATIQGHTPGRPFTDAYLAGPYKQQMRLVHASDADIEQINKVLFPQIHLELGPGALASLQKNAGLTTADQKGVEAFVKYKGKGSAFVYDDNQNGVIDEQDFIVLDGKDSRRTNELEADDFKGTSAMIEFVKAYQAHQPQFMPTNKPFDQWFPSQFWQWTKNPSNSYGGWWAYKGADAAKDLLDFLTNSSSYGGDCATLKQLAAHHVLSHQLGPTQYNKLVTKYGLHIGFNVDHNKNGLSKEVIRDGISPSSVIDIEPNTMGYAAVSLDDPPASASAIDIQNRENARLKLAGGNWSGEHFLLWIDTSGTKVVFAHPAKSGSLSAATFEDWLRGEVVKEVGPVDWKLQKSEVIITYKPNQIYDSVHARTL